jgi:hypothetical protein
VTGAWGKIDAASRGRRPETRRTDALRHREASQDGERACWLLGLAGGNSHAAGCLMALLPTTGHLGERPLSKAKSHFPAVAQNGGFWSKKVENAVRQRSRIYRDHHRSSRPSAVRAPGPIAIGEPAGRAPGERYLGITRLSAGALPHTRRQPPRSDIGLRRRSPQKTLTGMISFCYSSTMHLKGLKLPTEKCRASELLFPP